MSKNGYPKTVQSGVPKLSSCPVGWSCAPLGDYLHEVCRPLKMVNNQEYRLVTVKRARGGVVERERKLGKDILVKSQFYVHTGDFLISKRQIVHGACGLVPEELDGSIVSNEYAVLHGNEEIDLNYLNYLSHSIYFQQTCFHSSIGVHVEKMIFKLDQWLNWPFNLPPIQEQKRISEILQTWDQAIETVEALIANSQAQKKALMQQLIPVEGETLPKLRFSEFRDDWVLKRLGQLGQFIGGGTPSKAIDEYWQGSIPWISSSDIFEDDVHTIRISRFISHKAIAGSATKIVPKGSVLIVSRVGTGKLAVNEQEVCTSQDFTSFVSTEINNYFLAYYFSANKLALIGLGQGTSIKGFSKSDLECFKVSFPKSDEQQKIANCLSSIDELIVAQSQQLELLKEQKKGIMQQLLTGKRRVKVSAESTTPKEVIHA